MKHLISLFLSLVAAVVLGQGPSVHLGQVYNLDHITAPQLLASTGTAAQHASKYPHLYGWARAKGWSDAEIGQLCHGEAAWHNAFWSGENGNYNSATPGHAINITVPAWECPVIYPLPFAQGVYTGQGSRFHDNNGTHSYGSTEWYVDHNRWLKYSTDRIIMRSANWGVDGGYGAWVHHYRIEGFHFNGRRRTGWMPAGTAESAGVGAWDSGEASTIRNCYFENFERDGILLVRGTPAYIEACSMFTTSRFGIAIVGGASVTCVDVSGDESGISLVGSIAGYGRPGSTRLSVFGAKQETSTSAEFKPWKGSSFLYAEGWINATINGVSFASVWTTPYDFITWKRDPSVGNWSSIEVAGTHFFGNSPRCLMYEEASNKEYRFEGNAWQNAMQSFTWHEQHGLKTPWLTVTATHRTGPTGRLQHVGSDGANDWASAKIYDPTGGGGTPVPPPVQCTYTTGAWSAWSTCTNGTQTRTRTVTATPSGCTGTPPASTETQQCQTTPPPAGQTIAHYTFNGGTTASITATVGANLTQGTSGLRFTSLSGGKVSNSRAGATYPANWKGVTKVTLTGFTASALNYQILMGDANKKGLILLPNGAIVDNTSGGDVTVAPAGSVKLNTSVNLTLTLPVPRDLTFFGAAPGAGNCWQGSIDELKVE